LRPFNVLWQAIEQNIKRGVGSSHLRRHRENEKAFSLTRFSRPPPKAEEQESQ
jgi:hypothetical protein